MAKRKTTPEFKALAAVVILAAVALILFIVKTVLVRDNDESVPAALAPTAEDTQQTLGTSDTDDDNNSSAANTFAENSNYDAANLERYEEYQKNNPTCDAKTVVTMVNIGLDREFYTYTQAADLSLGNYIIVNKYNYLSEDYQPDDLVEISDTNSSRGGCKLRSEAAAAFEKLADAARDAGYSLLAYSGFRSYDFQNTIYNNLLKNDTKENVDTYSARPGYSEHQTGLAMDVCSKTEIYTDYEKDEGCGWVHENMHKYGFILRYTEENSSVTGYMAEAWHMRYVGVEAATYIYENNITFEEYYDTVLKGKAE